jgi:hypothetical protein
LFGHRPDQGSEQRVIIRHQPKVDLRRVSSEGT